MENNTNKNLVDREKERVENLRKYQILDSKSEPEFDQIAALAATIFDVPVALINFVDENRVWTKANQIGESGEEYQREITFCSRAIENETVTVYEDARKDDFYSNNPFVTGPYGLRFYAAAPIRTSEGYNIGVLCIVDVTPRHFSGDKLEQLQWIADLAKTKLEKRLNR